MKLLVIDEAYPHDGHLPGDTFVHVRVKGYMTHHDVNVISFSPEPKSLKYEGVNVDFVSRAEEVPPLIRHFKPDKILIHFFQSWMREQLIGQFDVPFIVWVHGWEAQGWYRRWFNHNVFSRSFLSHIYKNTLQQLSFRKLFREARESGRVHFVFVSHWMKKVAEMDTLTSAPSFSIIPNPIDTDLFTYIPKSADQRHRVLLFRSFSSKKYANDLSVQAILRLSRRPIFSSFTFTIIGEGTLFDSVVAPLRGKENVHIQRAVLGRDEIPELHRSHGIFLCPTRQDTHGVSMCEAMSSGLVPIASNNSAIPEYVTHGVSGLLTRTSSQIADALELLSDSPTLFQTLSVGATSAVKAQCAMKSVLRKELQVIETGP